MPTIHLRDRQLYVAYIVSQAESDGGSYAVVRFEDVLQHTFGYPNDEALGGHPLYSAGIALYSFNELHNSPYVRELGARNAKIFPGSAERYASLKHWIVTFHDETLEVIGHSVAFLGTIHAASAEEAISHHAI